MPWIELRRHTANDGDELTPDGVADAVALGERLDGNYAVVVSSGAQRATQSAGCLLAGLGRRVPRGVVIDTGLRSDREDEWRAAYKEAGGGHLDDLRRVAPELVEADAATLGVALARILDDLAGDEGALAVGHSPTNEAAVLGLTGQTVEPLGKGEGVRITRLADGTFTVQRLDA